MQKTESEYFSERMRRFFLDYIGSVSYTHLSLSLSHTHTHTELRTVLGAETLVFLTESRIQTDNFFVNIDYLWTVWIVRTQFFQ